MIVLDKQPVSIVESMGFTSLMKRLKRKYNLPSKKYFSDYIITRGKKKAKVKKGSINTITISVTTDLWRNTNNLQSFLNFIALNNNFQLQHAVTNKYFSNLHMIDNKTS